jgi:hypothetical protein
MIERATLIDDASLARKRDPPLPSGNGQIGLLTTNARNNAFVGGEFFLGERSTAMYVVDFVAAESLQTQSGSTRGNKLAASAYNECS